MTNQLTIALLVWVAIVVLRLHTLTHTCYLHVKDLIKGDQHAAYRALRAKQRLRNDAGLYQATLIKAANPARHVILLPRPVFFLLPIRRSLHGVIIHWTELVPYPTTGWLDDLSDAVAHFLGADPDELERRGVSMRRKRVRIVRTGVHSTPDHLSVDEFPRELPEPMGDYRDAR